MSAYLDISHAACRHCAAGIPFSQGRPKLYHWQSGMFSSVECTAPTKDAVIEQQASEIAGLRKAVKRAEEAEQRTDARYTQLMAIENSISGGAYEGGPVGEYIEAVTKLRTERDFATHRLSLSLGIVEELRTALNRLSKLLAVCKVRSPATKSILNGNIEAAGAALALTAPDSLHMGEITTLKAKLTEAELDTKCAVDANVLNIRIRDELRDERNLARAEIAMHALKMERVREVLEKEGCDSRCASVTYRMGRDEDNEEDFVPVNGSCDCFKSRLSALAGTGKDKESDLAKTADALSEENSLLREAISPLLSYWAMQDENDRHDLGASDCHALRNPTPATPEKK